MNIALAGLEQTINGLIGMDPAARAELARLHGRVVAIELTGLNLTLYLIPDQQGGLQLLGGYEGDPDCLLRGSPIDLLRAGDREQGADQLFGGRVSIEGDNALAQRFGRILGNLDIDWEEQLSHFTGDIIAHQAGRLARNAADYLHDGEAAWRQNLSEYLTEESRLLPHRYEVEAFRDDIERLRDDTARLEARVERLLSRAGERNKA